MHIKDHNDAMKFFRTSRQEESNGKWQEFVQRSEFEDAFPEPQAMAEGGEVIGKPGGLVEPGVEYYAKKKFDRPAFLQNIRDKESKMTTKSKKNINNWIKNWIKDNQSKYGVRDFKEFSEDLGKNFTKELNKNPNKYKLKTFGGQEVKKITDEGLPLVKDGIEINKIKFPGYRTVSKKTGQGDPKLAYQRLFYDYKLKDPKFKAEVIDYLNWNLANKKKNPQLLDPNISFYAGSKSKSGNIHYAKQTGKITDDVVFFMGEIMNNKALNPGGKVSGIHDIFKQNLGKKGDSYLKKYQGSWQRWTDNFFDVAKLAGLNETQANAFLQKQINDTQKIMKVYNVKKLPLEFMVAQDHIMGLAEAKALGDPKIAAKTLGNLVASTKEQNRYLGQQGFSTKRKALMKEFNKAPPKARQPIVDKINTLSEDFIPGRLKYDVRKDGSLKITNLQPEKSLKAKTKAYGKIAKTFPKNIQKLFTNSMQADLSPRSIAQLAKEHGCGTKSKGGSIMTCLQGKFRADPEKFLQKSAPLAKNNVNLFKWFKNGRKIARGTGVALAWEAAFAPIIAGWGALEGQSGQRILNDIAYGIPFIGETEKEEWMRESGDNELAYKMKRMGELEEQELPYLQQQRDDVINKMANVEGKSFHQRTIEDDIKEKKLELQGLKNTPEFYEGPAASYYNEPVIQDAFDLEQQTTAKIAADTAERKKATFDWLEKNKIYDPNWHSQVQGSAEGGIMNLKKKW